MAAEPSPAALLCVSTPSKGRGMTSVNDIPPGSLVHSEEPLAAVWDNSLKQLQVYLIVAKSAHYLLCIIYVAWYKPFDNVYPLSSDVAYSFQVLKISTLVTIFFAETVICFLLLTVICRLWINLPGKLIAIFASLKFPQMLYTAHHVPYLFIAPNFAKNKQEEYLLKRSKEILLHGIYQ